MIFKMRRVLDSVIFCIVISLISACRPAPPPQRELPDFALSATSSDGKARPLRRASLLGRVWVADFVFTRCTGPCPILSARMARAQDRLPASVGLISFSVDPDHDTPSVLAAYAARYGADPARWLFVTGPKAEITRLVKDGFLLPVAENAAARPGERVAHSSRFVLIDAQARVRGWYDGEDEAALARLERDAAALPR